MFNTNHPHNFIYMAMMNLYEEQVTKQNIRVS